MQLGIYKTDLLNKQCLKKALTKIKPFGIIHLAAYRKYRNQEEFEQMVEADIRGTLNLLIASKEIDYDILINTGSSSEYGIKSKPMKETDLLEPISFYAATKASSTLLCQAFSREYDKPIVTLRPFSTYGPYEETDRFVPTVMKSIIENKPIKLTPGCQRRDFTYVSDIVEAYIKTVKKGKVLSGQILNIGTGIEHTNDEVVKILFKIAGKKVKIEKGAYHTRIWDTKHWVADITKTKRLLNWAPKFKLEEGLRQTYLWYKKRNE